LQIKILLAFRNFHWQTKEIGWRGPVKAIAGLS